MPTTVVLGLFIGGFAVLLAFQGTGRIVAGIGVLIAALGIGWKTVPSALSNVGRRVMPPLWGARVRHSIGPAITIAPGFEAKRDRQVFERHQPAGPTRLWSSSWVGGTRELRRQRLGGVGSSKTERAWSPCDRALVPRISVLGSGC